jgi:hypothetical protein
VRAREIRLPVPGESLTFSLEINDTSIYQPYGKSLYSLADSGTPLAIGTTLRKYGLHTDHQSQSSLLIEYFEGGKVESNINSRENVRDRLTPSNFTGHPQLAFSNGNKTIQSNATSLNELTSKSSDITSPADIPVSLMIFKTLQD